MGRSDSPDSPENVDASGTAPPLNLAEISTRWTSLQDPQRFAVRYSPAILAYLEAILKDPHLARDVAQDFFIHFVERGLPRASRDRGRFRDYLKAAVRNAALTEFRKRQRNQADPTVLASIPDEQEAAADADMRRAWAAVMLEKLWRALDHHQRQNAGNYAYSVLKVSLEHAAEDSDQQAARVSRIVGQPLNAAAFRKQRSRARALAAQILLDEVRSTVAEPNEVEAELADLQLLGLLRDYLTDRD